MDEMSAQTTSRAYGYFAAEAHDVCLFTSALHILDATDLRQVAITPGGFKGFTKLMLYAIQQLHGPVWRSD